jgi:hypothetical protein
VKSYTHRWLDCLDRAEPSIFLTNPLVFKKGTIDELVIISCLQAIWLDSPNETFEYTYHGYQDHKKHPPRVQAALKNDEPVSDALKFYWVHKVSNRLDANMGRYHLRKKLREVEKICDNILLQILAHPNLEKMLDVHKFYLPLLDTVFNMDGIITITQNFERYIDYKGFKYIDPYFRIGYVCLRSPDASETYTKITDRIDEELKDEEHLTIKCTFKVLVHYGTLTFILVFTLTFDFGNYVCTMSELKMEDLIE